MKRTSRGKVNYQSTVAHLFYPGARSSSASSRHSSERSEAQSDFSSASKRAFATGPARAEVRRAKPRLPSRDVLRTPPPPAHVRKAQAEWIPIAEKIVRA